MIARKLAELFRFNRGVQPFYAACRSDELSRVSFSCLFNANLQKAILQRHNSIFTPKSMTMASTGANNCPMAASSGIQVALDLPYLVMRLAPYHLIRMAIEMAREAGAFFSVVDFMSCITVAK